MSLFKGIVAGTARQHNGLCIFVSVARCGSKSPEEIHFGIYPRIARKSIDNRKLSIYNTTYDIFYAR